MTEIEVHAKAGEFAVLPNGNPTFGFQDGAYWFYLPAVNRHPEEPRWLLVQDVALAPCIDAARTQHLGNANRRGWTLVPGEAALGCR